jgi:predicted KAP-like P-loop ATPase
MLSPDKPLLNPDEDRLGYDPFARNLANSICKMSPPEGLVIAIYGVWGAGKSTLIEFILHHLDKYQADEKPHVIRFNPWWFSGHENLVRQFFNQLYSEFGHLFGKGVRFLLTSIRKLGNLIGETPFETSKFAAKLVNSLPDFNSRDIAKVKDDISRELKSKKRRILIVIDDIDRLTSEEIRQLFALIKSVADFPNVTYLLAFDKDAVANSLLETYGIDGETFLEKIVQVPFEIPAPTKSKLANWLLDEIETLFDGAPRRFYENNWLLNASGYLVQIHTLLNTPRDIFRLINTLKVTYSAVKGEVDPADFIAIEAIRVFRSSLYHDIRNNKFWFTTKYGYNADKSIVASILNDETDDVKQLITGMFPNIREAYAQGHAFEQQWRMELRICSPEIFDVYFMFGVPANTISNQEMLAIIEAAHQPEALETFFKQLAKSDIEKLRLFLFRIEDYYEIIGEHYAETFARVILNIGDTVIEQETDSYRLQNPRQIPLRFTMARVIVDLLRQISIESQFNAVKRLLSDSYSIYLKLDVVYVIGYRHGKYGNNDYTPRETKLLMVEDISELEKLTIPIISRALEYYQSFATEKIDWLLDFWVYLDPNQPKMWVKQNIASPTLLLELIRRYVEPISSADVSISDKLYRYFDRKWLIASISDLIEADSVTANELKFSKAVLKALQQV